MSRAGHEPELPRPPLTPAMAAYLAAVRALADAAGDRAVAEYHRGRALERAASGQEDVS